MPKVHEIRLNVGETPYHIVYSGSIEIVPLSMAICIAGSSDDFILRSVKVDEAVLEGRRLEAAERQRLIATIEKAYQDACRGGSMGGSPIRAGYN